MTEAIKNFFRRGSKVKDDDDEDVNDDGSTKGLRDIKESVVEQRSN